MNIGEVEKFEQKLINEWKNFNPEVLRRRNPTKLASDSNIFLRQKKAKAQEKRWKG